MPSTHWGAGRAEGGCGPPGDEALHVTEQKWMKKLGISRPNQCHRGVSVRDSQRTRAARWESIRRGSAGPGVDVIARRRGSRRAERAFKIAGG